MTGDQTTICLQVMGQLIFDTLFNALNKVDYEGYLSIEPSFAYSADPDDAASQGIKFFKRYFRSSGKKN